MARKTEDNSKRGDEARAQIAAQQREHRRRNRGNAETADWSNADPTKLYTAICNLTGNGCAIQFGYTKDGGSFVIRIVGDGEPYNEYVRPSESIDEYLEALANDYAK